MIRSMLGGFARRFLGLAVLVVTSGFGTAADVTPPPVAAAPATLPVVAAPCCETCGSTAGVTSAGGCASCGKSRFKFGHKAPYQTYLCPGACFGYFQTQWSRWDEVCPLPYKGAGLTDAPTPRPEPIGPITPPRQLPPDNKKPDTMTPPSKPDSMIPTAPAPTPVPGTPLPKSPGTGLPLVPPRSSDSPVVPFTPTVPAPGSKFGS